MMILVILGCLVLSFFFSGMETGVLLLNRARVRHLKERGSLGARILLDFMHRPGHLSATVLVGNTLVNSVAIVLVLRIAMRSGHLGSALFWVVLFAGILWIFGDLISKALFRRFPNRFTTRLAPLLLATSVCLWPVVRLFDFFSLAVIRAMGGKVSSRQMFVTREELKLMAREGERNFPLSGEQLNLVASILDSPNATAREVMRPRSEVVCVKSTQSRTERFQFAATTPYSRFPVEPPSPEGLRQWEGVWVVYDTLFGVRKDLHFPVCLPFTTPLEEILSELRKAKSPLAFVRDGEGNDVGIVTVEDVLRRYHGKIDL